MVVQISSFYKLDIWIFSCYLIGETIDTVNQNSGEEEIGEDHNTFVAQFGCML